MVGDLLLVGHLGVGLFFCFNGVGGLVLLLVRGLLGCLRGDWDVEIRWLMFH